MRPRICYNINNLKEFSFEKCPFEGYEFKTFGRGFKPNIIILAEIRKNFKGLDLSLHSQLSRIFSCNEKGFPEFEEAEMSILKSEIIISKMIGVRQINFHMKETDFTEEEIKKFNEIINFAEQNGIEMIYENHVCSEEVILRVLNTFPRINFCLDIGHLNVAIHKGKFNMNLKEFLEKVKSKLVHIHAHNNYGEKDEHNSLDNGNFDWKFVLESLKDANLKKIIVENNTNEQSIRSKKLLEEFYKKAY